MLGRPSRPPYSYSTTWDSYYKIYRFSAKIVMLLNRMSSEVMRVVFDHEPFPTETVQSMAPTHRVRRAADYMAAMGSAEYPGCSWTYAVIIMQCIHDVLRLFSGLAEVKFSFPSGGKMCDEDIWPFCIYCYRPDM